METSGFALVGGLGYVVLRNEADVIAVYRVRSDNLMLRRMARPPATITGVKPSAPESVGVSGGLNPHKSGGSKWRRKLAPVSGGHLWRRILVVNSGALGAINR